MAQTVKNLPAMWETWVRSLGQEDPLEKGMATHSSILVWRIPWIEGILPGASESQTWSGMTEQLTRSLFTFFYTPTTQCVKRKKAFFLSELFLFMELLLQSVIESESPMFEFWLSYLTSFSSLFILASTSKKIMLPCSCSWVESIPFSPLSVMLSVNVFVYAHHYEDFLKINLKTFLLANYESIFLIFRESPLTTRKPKSTVRKFKEV